MMLRLICQCTLQQQSTDEQGLAYCTRKLQLWRTAHACDLSDESLQQLARDVVERSGNRILQLEALAADWELCCSVDEIIAVCRAAQQQQQLSAKRAVKALVQKLNKLTQDAAAVDAFFTQLLQSSSGIPADQLPDGCPEYSVYDANAAHSPHVLQVHPSTGMITLDSQFIADAVKQHLAKRHSAKQQSANADVPRRSS